MTLRQKYSIAAAVLLVSLAVFVYSFSPRVRAAINMFSPTDCYTAAATTSPSYLATGATTSAVTCNLGYEGARSAVLNVQVNASSTASVFRFYVEESMDGVDWFPISQNQVASTTEPFNLSVGGLFDYKFASSTIGQGSIPVASGVGINGTDNRNHFSLKIPVNMKRVRVIARVSGAAGAVWMQIVPKVDVN